MAQGFAQQSGGALSIQSEPGRGTIVNLWLPQADLVVGPVPEVVETPAATADIERKHRVLVVDDDELVREVVMLSLEEAGFAADGAEDASRALAYPNQGKAVDALVTDFAIPGANGVDLIREVQRRQPALPTILLTGHVGDIAAAPIEPSLRGRITILQKPVRPAELDERLTVAIEAQGHRNARSAAATA